MIEYQPYCPSYEQARANPDSTISMPGVRFTLLTPRLIRVEISPTNSYEDRPSQVFWYRNQPLPTCKIDQLDNTLNIESDVFHLSYQNSKNTWLAKNLKITIKETNRSFGIDNLNEGQLPGTARTLDEANGQIPLQPGLLSRSGWVQIDDTPSLVFTHEGWLDNRPKLTGYRDLYFLISGSDYKAALRDYQKISGTPALLPRAFLGNWWSRYWEYSQEDIQKLVRRFAEEGIPLSTYIIDMDWHITKTGNTSTGWTGFSWNRELFPDPPAILDWLHQQHLITALNLHPAEGIHPHEDQYIEAARAMGINPDLKKPISFDISDPKFTKTYFEKILHPLEEQGVDFWWLDWQQGEFTKLPGLDPLWWLNHLHYFDLARDGKKRPIIFSRWGGAGNQRYPIGFSGDTIITWESLGFQPYFTSTAANSAYGWWSHDIGGHMRGIEDQERYVRWVQFGVLSPIFRLHSAKDQFIDRHPWGFDAEVLQQVRRAMQFRHALIPYLYTMAKRNQDEGVPPITPLYYEWPQEEAAYITPNQYMFGSQLMAAPVTSPVDPETGFARQTVWLPEGDWFDFWNGTRHQGGCWKINYYSLSDIPLFAKAGSILPLQAETKTNGAANPEQIDLIVFSGEDGSFTLYEDDGATQAYLNRGGANTLFTSMFSNSSMSVTIHPVEGDCTHIPEHRNYRILFRGVSEPDQITAHLNNNEILLNFTYDYESRTACVKAVSVRSSDSLNVEIKTDQKTIMAEKPTLESEVIRFLKNAKMESVTKWKISTSINEINQNPKALLHKQIRLTNNQKIAILEIIKGAGAVRITHPFYGEIVVVCNPNQNPGFKYQGIKQISIDACGNFSITNKQVKSEYFGVIKSKI